MKKLTILVDMDDTIEDLLHSWLRYLNNRYGLNVTDREVRDWDLTVAYPTLTAKQVYGVLYEDEFWEDIQPFPRAAEFLQRLLADGHEIYIVTSSNYQTIKTKMEKVLFRHFPFLDWNHVIVTNNKQMIKGDFLVDDAPHNLVGGDYIPIMMNAPHNRSFSASEYGIQRVDNWTQIYEIISNYASR